MPVCSIHVVRVFPPRAANVVPSAILRVAAASSLIGRFSTCGVAGRNPQLPLNNPSTLLKAGVIPAQILWLNGLHDTYKRMFQSPLISVLMGAFLMQLQRKTPCPHLEDAYFSLRHDLSFL